jgi:hypothetical protein
MRAQIPSRQDPANCRKDNSTDSEELFYTERELADRWKISVKALQKWRLTGDGPTFHKIGRSVRYALQEIEVFEQAQRCDSTSNLASC